MSVSSGISDTSEKLNNCDTCEQIKNDKEFDKDGSNYSSDFEELSSFSDSVGKETNFDSLSLSLIETKSEKSSKNSFRKPIVVRNKTFSSEKIREINRTNAMLVDRILYHNKRPNQYKPKAVSFPNVTSAEINRRRHQEKISRENEILLKKIQSVKPAVRY